jgi:2,4-dichlorophenol 6-monooxygenase
MFSSSPVIAIAGAGPTGLSLAILLRMNGFSPVIFEREPSLVKLPQAHVVNTRTLEIFDEMGVSDRCVAAGDGSLFGPVRWCESISGRQYGRLWVADPATGTPDRRLSHHRPINLAQNIVEPILYDRLVELGGGVRFGEKVTNVGLAEDRATLSAVSGSGVGYHFACDWLIGCDGAGSTVRRAIGITMEGPPSLARFMTIYFRTQIDSLLDGPHGALYWIGGPEARGIMISFDNDTNYAMLVPIGDLPVEAFSDEMATTIIRKAIGEPAAEIELVGLSSWNMSAQVADRFREGRVFLAGDACHRFPPTGGLGMNTGIQDAHNLAWKLAAVIRGKAGPALLDSYQAERRPIAQRNTDQSVYNLRNMAAIDEALGISALAPVTLAAGSGPITRFPAEILGIDNEIAGAAVKRQAVQSAIDDQRGHFGDSVGIDLGFSYTEGAFESDGSPPPSQGADHYEPDAHPGARLPWFEWTDAAGHRRPSLELLSHDEPTLFTCDPAWGKVINGQAALRVLDAADSQALRVLGITAEGAVLVRPDGHVGWRSPGCVIGRRAAFSAALQSIYCLQERGELVQ